MKRCSKCKVVKPEEDFYRNKAQRSGLSNQCRPCFKETCKASIARNPERFRERHNRAVRKYMASHPEQAEKAALRNKMRKDTDERRSEQLERYHANHAKSPLVYFIGPADHGMGVVKIGSTDNLPVRKTILACGSPVPLEVYTTIPCADREEMKRLERQIHRQYREQRSHGEWYRLTSEMVLTYGLFAPQVAW